MRHYRAFSFAIGFLVAGGAFASFCGQSAIPFSFEALPNGQPVLGCARPSCFGWTADGRAASPPATFYRVNKKPDGYFRKDVDGVRPRPVPAEYADSFRVQTAECSKSFDSEQCPSNYWVGGIGPTTNLTGNPLPLQCCQYSALGRSTDRGVAAVAPGQIVFGGEILNEKRQYAFDYISDVAKHVRDDGTVSYDVSVRRLLCLPYPPEFSVTVEASVNEELIRRFSNTRKGKSKAFQAPTVVGNSVVDGNLGGEPGNTVIGTAEQTVLEPAGERVDVIEGPFVAENDAVAGELPAEQGFELPPGQIPQEIIQLPPPPPQAPPVQAPAYGGYGGYSGYGSGVGFGGGRGFYCFTADTTVRVSGGRTKRMDELQVGDFVMSEYKNKVGYSKVKSWIHRMPEVLTQFHCIELENGNVLKLTGKHFIYRTQCSSTNEKSVLSEVALKPVFAELVQAGDCLYVREKISIRKQNDMGLSRYEQHFVESRVQSVSIVEELGIYSPMTKNGKIIVNDILASCFNVVENDTIQDTFFSYLAMLREIPLLKWLLGISSSDTTELPSGMGLMVDLLEYAVPKHSQLIP